MEKVAGDFKGNVSRTLELANLLETLQKFDISVDVICHNTAEGECGFPDDLKNIIANHHALCNVISALKSLYKSEGIYVEKLRNLRQLTWTYKKKNAADEAERNLLRQQNSVLKDIVKDLKRKVCLHQWNKWLFPFCNSTSFFLINVFIFIVIASSEMMRIFLKLAIFQLIFHTL